jgi:hypothetical protein
LRDLGYLTTTVKTGSIKLREENRLKVYEKKIVHETGFLSLREGVAGRRENCILRSYIFALFPEHY